MPRPAPYEQLQEPHGTVRWHSFLRWMLEPMKSYEVHEALVLWNSLVMVMGLLGRLVVFVASRLAKHISRSTKRVHVEKSSVNQSPIVTPCFLFRLPLPARATCPHLMQSHWTAPMASSQLQHLAGPSIFHRIPCSRKRRVSTCQVGRRKV